MVPTSLSQPSGAGGKGHRDPRTNYTQLLHTQELQHQREDKEKDQVESKQYHLTTEEVKVFVVPKVLMLSTSIYPNPPGPGARDKVG